MKKTPANNVLYWAMILGGCAMGLARCFRDLPAASSRPRSVGNAACSVNGPFEPMGRRRMTPGFAMVAATNNNHLIVIQLSSASCVCVRSNPSLLRALNCAHDTLGHFHDKKACVPWRIVLIGLWGKS